MDRLRALSVVLASLSLLAAGPPPASSAESSGGHIELDEVVVSVERPGPAMWKVAKGDHTLWIMGTLSPMPAKMSWRQKRAEEAIQASGEILAASSSDWDMDLGFREAVGMIRTLLKLRHNADGSTLREVLPEDVYERWHAAHRRWFGEKPSPKERARPLYASILLYSAEEVRPHRRAAGVAKGGEAGEAAQGEDPPAPLPGEGGRPEGHAGGARQPAAGPGSGLPGGDHGLH
jgi:hypothetical protein